MRRTPGRFPSRSNPTRIAALLVVAASWASTAAAAESVLVICAPGYPGTTDEAQASMDRLAEAINDAVGPVGPRVQAAYYEDEEAGLKRLAEPATQIAILPLPFYLKHHKGLHLVPRLQAVMKDGEPEEAWTLVARKGRVTGPASLAGWEIVSLAGYAPAFVRGTALGAWGAIPPSAKVVPSGQVLSALRRAAKDDRVAVLLDAMQASSLSSLPFAPDLEVVARSAPVPTAVVCTIAGRTPEGRARSWSSALSKLGARPGGAAVLDEVRISRFIPLDSAALDAARRAFDRASAP